MVEGSIDPSAIGSVTPQRGAPCTSTRRSTFRRRLPAKTSNTRAKVSPNPFKHLC